MFGLIFVSFGPFNIFPNTYPPMSLKTEINIEIIKKNKFSLLKRYIVVKDTIKKKMPKKNDILLIDNLIHSKNDNMKIIIKNIPKKI